MIKNTTSPIPSRPEDEDTIVALATPPGEGALALIRVSGEQACTITRKLCPFLPSKPQSHHSYFGTLVHPTTREALDEVLISFFEKGRSFTGEESTEISVHGGSFISSSILEALVVGGARPAERGEFTYRAFMQGRMDLVQAESVLNLIQSRSPKAHSSALKSLKGHLSRYLEQVEKKLLKLLAHLEATIDFSSQELEPFSKQELKKLLTEIKEQVRAGLKSFKQARIDREGFTVLFLGAPNAGKSSLFNYLVESDKAIVTEHPGTTRDILSGRILFNQREFCLKDTAGFRENPDPIEKKGIDKVLEEIHEADLCLFLVESHKELKPESFFGFEQVNQKKTQIVFSKSDQLNPKEQENFLKQVRKFLKDQKFEPLWLSVHEEKGLKEIKKTFSKKSETEVSEIFLSTPRQLRAFEKIEGFLNKASLLLDEGASPELTAFELQAALSVLYSLLGKEYSEEVIEQIFKEFCLGK